MDSAYDVADRGEPIGKDGMNTWEARHAALRAKIPPSTMALAEKGILVARELWKFSEAFVGSSDDEPEAWLEVVLHELAHAVSVGVEVDSLGKELLRRVSDLIPEEEKVKNEADTLATEYFVWCLLGLPWDVNVLEDLGEVQGVGSADLAAALFDPSAKERAAVLLDLLWARLPLVLSPDGGVS